MITPDIRTERHVLSCLEVDEVDDAYAGWMADPETVQYLETRGRALGSSELRDYVAGMRASQDSYLFGIFTADDRRHIGNIKLGPISSRHGSASIGLVIGEKDHWGRGVASEAIAAVADWAFSELGLAKLTAGSYARNAGSVRAFERSGFAIEGVQRGQVRLDDGSRDDVILLGRLRDDGDGEAR
jgi:[ribosomal protein S5]-alanine N-acetyltransferase